MAGEATDTPEMTESEAGAAAMDALTGVSTEETEVEAETEETEETEEVTTEEADSSDSEETEETETEPEDEVAAKPESVFGDLKALAGRVPSLQRENAQNKSEITKLNETVMQLREMLTPKQQQETEGLIDSLTSDNGDEFLDSKIQDVVKKMYGSEIEAQKQTRERMDYYQKLQNLSGDKWDAIEPAATAVIAEAVEAREKGEPWADEVMQAIENPITLKLLAERHISMNVGERSKAQREKRKEVAKRVSGSESSSPDSVTGTTVKDIRSMTPAEAEKNIRELLKSKGQDYLTGG